MNGSAPIVKRLLDAGAKPDAALLTGETPADGGGARGQVSRRGRAAREGRQPERARARAGRPRLMWAVAQMHADVVKRLLLGGADVHARTDTLEPDDGRAAARPAGIQPDDSSWRRYGADVRGSRRRSRVGEDARRGGREPERSRRMGCQRDDARGVRRTWRDRAVAAREGRRSQQRQARIYGTPLRHHAARRSDRRSAARAWRKSECAGEDVDADPPIVGRLSLHAGARRCHAVSGWPRALHSRASCACSRSTARIRK